MGGPACCYIENPHTGAPMGAWVHTKPALDALNAIQPRGIWDETTYVLRGSRGEVLARRKVSGEEILKLRASQAEKQNKP